MSQEVAIIPLIAGSKVYQIEESMSMILTGHGDLSAIHGL